ncbi:rubrerythrin family protein [Jeotgalibacillus proteolyticus]|uniref:Rubrerythrin family protein n=2 Tax=Jeotgalibacillus proteolyticus TaxID=2082395 RepID=A0A2S5G974_9BACL|nr:rubrerythrin family protein [Jeotgalibacillus proteolyticus]
MAGLAPVQEESNRILEIQQDERRHFEEFSTIYMNLTGVQPTPQLNEGCHDTYRDALTFAFKDEQETVDFYLDLADRAQNPHIKQVFKRAAADEQNHAVWFLFLSRDPERTSTKRQNDFGAVGALNAQTLTLPQMLTYAMQDEYLAQARYDAILAAFGYIPTFYQIKEAELRHIAALNALFERYQIPMPENIAQTLVSTPEIVKNAFAAGVQGEIDNIAMYDKFLTYELPADLSIVFNQLRNASRNHLAAFEKGLGREFTS